jgi:HlyD family secretion protein
MRSLTLLLALSAATVPAALMPAFAQDAAAPAAATSLPAITVSSAQKRVLRDVIIVSGLVGAQEEVQINPMVQGQQVAELLVDVGDRVSAGQVMARLSSSALSLQNAQLLAAIEAAKAAGDSAAQARLEAELAKVTADLARADLTIRRTEIVAPVAGEISARNAELGALAGASGQPMFTIIRDGALELQADVSESDLLRVAKGQKVALTLVGAQSALSGTVRLVEPTIDTQTRLGRVRIAFDDSSLVRVGMFVEAAISVAERSTIAVPVTAVGRYEGKPTVMAIVDGTAQRREVQTGIREGGWIEIASGLTEGETIVTKAGAFVRNGDKINPVPETAN